MTRNPDRRRKNRRQPAPTATGVRIIAGLYRRRRIKVVSDPGLRPTPDRVRETLFNWLGDRIHQAHCLDLFAGSGILGLEAASRGAARVVCVEIQPRTAGAIRTAAAAVGAATLDVDQADAMIWLQGPPEPFDIVFLDPPFGRCDFSSLLQRLHPHWLAPEPLVYIESKALLTVTELPGGWELLRNRRAGKVFSHLLTYSGAPRKISTGGESGERGLTINGLRYS